MNRRSFLRFLSVLPAAGVAATLPKEKPVTPGGDQIIGDPKGGHIILHKHAVEINCAPLIPSDPIVSLKVYPTPSHGEWDTSMPISNEFSKRFLLVGDA